MQFLRIGKGKSGGVVLFAVFSLLVLYLAGTVELESFHSTLHATPEEQELHSEINESNACHQSVYHNKAAESCEHKSHIIALKKCALCHLSLQTFQFFSVKPNDVITIATEQAVGDAHTVITGGSISLLPPRAPPIA